MLWNISNDCDCRAGSQYDLEEVQRYQETKERVFFEGFVYNTEEEWLERAESDGGLWTIDPDEPCKAYYRRYDSMQYDINRISD